MEGPSQSINQTVSLWWPCACLGFKICHRQSGQRFWAAGCGGHINEGAFGAGVMQKRAPLHCLACYCWLHCTWPQQGSPGGGRSCCRLHHRCCRCCQQVSGRGGMESCCPAVGAEPCCLRSVHLGAAGCLPAAWAELRGSACRQTYGRAGKQARRQISHMHYRLAHLVPACPPTRACMRFPTSSAVLHCSSEPDQISSAVPCTSRAFCIHPQTFRPQGNYPPWKPTHLICAAIRRMLPTKLSRSLFPGPRNAAEGCWCPTPKRGL